MYLSVPLSTYEMNSLKEEHSRTIEIKGNVLSELKALMESEIEEVKIRMQNKVQRVNEMRGNISLAPQCAQLLCRWFDTGGVIFKSISCCTPRRI